MQIIIDLDGTICTEEKTYSRSLAIVKKRAKEAIQKLFDEGNTIIIYSSRSWMEYEMTYYWLKNNNIPFHQLVLGKPIGDIWIDDRALQFNDNWEEIIIKLNKNEKDTDNSGGRC